MSESPLTDIRSEAHRLIDALPENASWDDVMYRVYVRQCVDAGLEDAQADRVVDVSEVRSKFGLSP